MSNFTVLTTKENERTKPSPAVLAFEQELENLLMRIAKKANSTGDGYAIGDNAGNRKVDFSKLFKEYKPRLQKHYFVEKLMQIGSFLSSVKAFRMAKFQCFTRYLREVSPDFTCIEAVAGYSFDKFQETFFPKGLEDVQTIDTIRVLCEDAMCSYQLLIKFDPKLQNPETTLRCENTLKILRLTTQLALHQESFSWLVYNGTIHIYAISRQLMVAGKSTIVLEYLLWACMCMEASIPLLTLKYVPWRSTLYAAVSLCYLDCKEPQHAETFARRAIKKINELSDIENISTSVSNPETKAIFQAAKVKINAIVFQRVVFESRKRPKGVLRPKARPPLKEALHQNWPRCQTERLLSDLFEGSAAQFLAILQTLGDPHRRTLQCRAPTGAIDDITLDIYPELFVAGVDLLSAGNSGTRGSRHDPEVHPSCLELSSISLLHLSEQGFDGVPLPFAVQFIKMSFSYEQWDVLDVLLQPFISLLKTSSLLPQTPAYIMALNLLVAMEQFYNTGRKPKKGVTYSDSWLQENSQGSKSSMTTADDLLVIANILNGSSTDLPKSSLPYLDVDMIIDATLFLWARCKPYFQRVVSCNFDSCRQVLNDPDCDKWLYILLTIHNVLHWSGLSDIDPVMTGEVALKLALILECRATSSSRINKAPNLPKWTETREVSGDQPSKSKMVDHETNQKPDQSQTEVENKPYKAAFPNNTVDLLYMAFNILESSVERVSEAREKMEGGFKVCETVDSDKTTSTTDNADNSPTTSTETDIQIIHVELLFNLTRLLARLDAEESKDAEGTASTEKSKTSLTSVRKQTKKVKDVEGSWLVDIIKKYSKTALTKALLLMHKTHIQNTSSSQTKQQLQECYDLIKKAQTREKILASKCKTSEHCETSDTPPSPIVVFRSSSKIILKPAPYKPCKNDKVCWYRLFGCSAAGSNVKVRLNDADLIGSGEEVAPGPDCRFYISNLVEGERYVFAVAAYDKNGLLIGDGIGPTGHPIPACHPMPVIMPWGYLTQIAYSCAVYDVARASALVLWKYFVPDCDSITEDSNEQQSPLHDPTKLKINRCDEKRLANSNQALLRQLLQSIFVLVDIAVQDGKLYCDSLCDYGPLLPGQVNRIRQSEKMLLALQVALWLNDNTLVLQSVARCYGLLTPLVHLRIPAKPVVQVLLQCYAVLQEIPSISRYRKHSVTSDSLYHLVAIVTYYLANVLPLYGEQDLANTIQDYGRNLLSIDPPPESAPSVGVAQVDDGQAAAGNTSQKSLTKKTKKPVKIAGKKSKAGAVKLVVKPAEQTNKAKNFQKREFVSLENYFSKLNSEVSLVQKSEDELTGSEDPAILSSYITGLSTQEAYKEVIKFKRRTKYMQYFVQAAEKALAEKWLEKVLEWSNETEQWLIKRNDLLMPTLRPLLVHPLTELGGEETRNKKFAAAIVEFGKPATKKNLKSMRQLLDTLSETKTGGAGGKSDVAVSPRKPTQRARKDIKTWRKGRTPEEQDMIRAIEALQNKLPEFWKADGRKRKLRALSNEEKPWRCQWNILRASASFGMFLKNTKKQDMSSPDSIAQDSMRAPMIDVEWFGFDVSGILISRKTTNLKETSSSLKAAVVSFAQHSTKAGKKTREQPKIDDTSENLRHIYNASKYLSRAVVLSFRCKCWGLLQNAACNLWNLKQRLHELVADPMSFLTEEIVQGVLWLAFYHTTDSLLDMVLLIQKDKTDTTLSKNKSSSPSLPKDVTFWGGIEDEKGGSDLIFEEYLDDQTIIDVVWIKRVIMYTMELLFYQNKWEKLADIIFRFNALTRGRYAENILPVLAISQQKLHERAQDNGGVSTNQPEIKISRDSGKSEGFNIIANSCINVDPAFHIDPKGHDVYSENNDSLRLFSVSTDKTSTLQLLKHSVEVKHCAARALQHSRQLFLRYLAGLSHQRKSASRVAFVPPDDQAVTSLPPDISEQKFDKIDDVEKFPLSSTQLAVVITSYDKTIEMLQFHGRKALLAQAMSELGNIMLHVGNTRSAFRWWQAVLDTILSPISSSKHSQQSHNAYHNAVHVAPSILLKKRGMWGCLLGATTAVKVAQYIHTDNTDKRLDYCCVAASLLKALFSSSLPHPSASCDFALYDIGNGFPVGSLIPGINLFSDPFRCDPKVLLTSTVWLAEELLETGHYLMVLPLLTLARFISSDIFDDESWVIKVRILRVRALTKAGLYSQSYVVLNSLFSGRCTKHLLANTQYKNTNAFQCNQPVTDSSNIQAINNLICLRLSPGIAVSYGIDHSRSLTLEQARLIIAIASTIYATPLDVKTQLMEKLGGETASNMSTSDISKLSKSFKINLFEENVSESVTKSYLLAGAELLLEELRHELLGAQKDTRDYLEARGEHFKPSVLKILILTELELASIRQQHLESLSAAKIIYTSMRALEEASLMLEHDQKRFGSAWTAFSRSSDPNKTPELLRDDFTPVTSELDPHLWLACRMKMVACLSCEDNSIGRIAGFSRSVISLTGSAEQHCNQGMEEADAFGNTEVLTEFQLASVLLRLQHGILSRVDVDELKSSIEVLQNLHPLSVKGRLLLVKILLYYGDLITSYDGTKEDSSANYKQAETILCDELKEFGETVEDCIKESSTSSIKNIYLPHIILLAETKLRLGRILTEVTGQSSDVKTIQEALSVLQEGLVLTRAVKNQQNPLESEFLYLTGVLRHLLWLNGQCSETAVISTFIDAITKTYNFDHNLELMKDCYEQLAFFYLAKIQQLKPEISVEEVKESSSVSIKISRSNSKLSRKEKEEKTREKKQEIKAKRETEKELKAAWVAIRAAATTTAVINKRGLLLGDVTHLSISKATGDKIPKCVIHDLLGAMSVVLDPDDGSCMKGDGVITMESYINGFNIVQLSWVHLLSHANYLHRQVSYQSLGIRSVGHGGPLFRWQKLLKLCQVRHLLTTELEVYVNTCYGVYPSSLLLLPDAPGKQDNDSIDLGKNVDEADEHEVSIQWRSWDQLWKGTRNETDSECIQCLYAFNDKAVNSVTMTGVFAGTISTSYKTIVEVHEQLRELLELAETDLSTQIPPKLSKGDISNSQGSTTTPQTSRKKRTAGIRTLSGRGRKDDQIQLSLRECLNALTSMLKPSLLSDKKEVPIEASYANILVLENMFDPARGYIGKIPESFYTWLSSMFL